MWKKVLTSRYGKEIPWLSEERMKDGLKCSSLWWRDIVSLGADSSIGKFWFNEVARKKLGNGKTMKFWTEEWAGNETIKSMFPLLYEVSDRKNAYVVDMGVWINNRWSWNWSGMIRAELWGDGSELTEAAEALKEILIGLELAKDMEDKWVWLIDTVKGFSVKSCYGWLCNGFAGTNYMVDAEAAEACKKMWKMMCQQKCLF